jgi:surface carbohydrate biosynthesis protein
MADRTFLVKGARRTRPPRVALVVDHPERDLPGLVLTALDLAQRGVVCHLVPVNLQEREIWALEPDFVLFNYLRRSNERFAAELMAAGIAFGSIDTEGAIWPDLDEYTSLLWLDAWRLREARCVCMWGQRLADHLIASGFLSRDQVVVTGCPRFDLYANPWRHLREDADAALQRPARRILINTNFSITNPLFTTADKCMAMHHAVLGYSKAELKYVADAEAVAIHESVSIATQLAELLPPGIEVVIRPHPFEDPAPYRAATSGCRNVIVNQSESIQAAIFSACAVIQRSCTTAIEAGLAGVPAFSPQWMPAPFLMPDAEAASVPCESFPELLAHLRAVLDGTFHLPAVTRQGIAVAIRDCCFAADGLAHRRVADAVFSVLDPREVDHERCRRSMYGLPSVSGAATGPATVLSPGTALARAAQLTRLRLSLSPDWSFRHMREVPAVAWMNSNKYFDAMRVARLVNRVRAIGGFAQGDLDDVVVRGEEWIRDGHPTFARYGATIAPRWWAERVSCTPPPAPSHRLQASASS